MTKETPIKRTFQDFNPDDLDIFERMQYEDLLSKGMSKENVLQILINNVEGDYSQLSDELCDLAMMMETNTVKS